MRRLVELIPVQVITNRGRLPSTEALYGPKWRDLRDFVSRKHQIRREDAAEILHTVFTYISGEVAGHLNDFKVPGFGTFRAQVRRGRSVLTGVAREVVTITLHRVGQRYHGALHEQHEDPEDVPDEELE